MDKVLAVIILASCWIFIVTPVLTSLLFDRITDGSYIGSIKVGLFIQALVLFFVVFIFAINWSIEVLFGVS